MDFSIPLGLKQALESEECVLFVGAGMGKHMIGPDNRLAPSGVELARELATHFKINTDSEDLAKISQAVENRKGRESLEDFVRKRLANLQPDDHLRWLLSRFDDLSD